MYERQEFVEGLHAFLDYTDPETFRNRIKEGLVVRRCSQNKEEAFERRCIQRWAISELTKAILDEPEKFCRGCHLSVCIENVWLCL